MAIIFLLGKIIRSHTDIDLVTWLHYRDTSEQALVNAGLNNKACRLKQFPHKNNVDVSFVFVGILIMAI